MADSGAIRASDADRERAADQVREHYAAGRLASDELSDRLDAAYSAITRGQLAELLTDLPGAGSVEVVPVPPAGPVSAHDEARTLARRRVVRDAGLVVMLNVACIVVWLASGAHGQFWPEWVLLVSVLRLARDAWLWLGPAGDPQLAMRDRHDRHERRHEAREHRHDRHL